VAFPSDRIYPRRPVAAGPRHLGVTKPDGSGDGRGLESRDRHLVGRLGAPYRGAGSPATSGFRAAPTTGGPWGRPAV